jgi:hypothetical protein
MDHLLLYKKHVKDSRPLTTETMWNLGSLHNLFHRFQHHNNHRDNLREQQTKMRATLDQLHLV